MLSSLKGLTDQRAKVSDGSDGFPPTESVDQVKLKFVFLCFKGFVGIRILKHPQITF